MNLRTLSTLAAAAAIGISGCRRSPTASGEGTPAPGANPGAEATPLAAPRLRAAVDAYKQVQNPENDAAVRQGIAEVNTEIANLEDLVAKRHGRDRQKVASKLRHLEAYLSEETTRFAEIQAAPALKAPNPASESPPDGKAGGAAPPPGSGSDR